MRFKDLRVARDLWRAGVSDLPSMAAEVASEAARKSGIASRAIERACKRFKYGRFDRRWLRTAPDGTCYYDFNGAKVAYDPRYPLYKVFIDSLMVYCLHDDVYDKELMLNMDYMWEGAYGYTGDGIDVRVWPGDVVIDAGAWIGDFSAYAAAVGATAYAFEPTPDLFAMLERTAALNGRAGEMGGQAECGPEAHCGAIAPVQAGLGDGEGELTFYVSAEAGGKSEGNRFTPWADGTESITARVTTLDAFVRERGLERVDFIKADIEGFERNMLMGAQQTLRRFAPRLALCTYHLPDDPEVMVRLILEANPDYRIVQLGKKLFAEV